MFGFGKPKNLCSDCLEPCKASHNDRTSCALFKPKGKAIEIMEVTVFRAGDDLQYVTMHINDWYKILKNLKSPIHNKWGVKNGKK